jgi:AbiJ N-terminal domain 4
LQQDDRPFSRRFGYRGPEQEITIREDAPETLRQAIVSIAKDLGLSPSNMRLGACSILRKLPDSNNWSEYPNVFYEVQGLIESCPWHKVYDIAEEFYDRLRSEGRGRDFEEALNEVFREDGIGWAMEDGRIVARGSEAFSAVPKQAIQMLQEAGRLTAAGEIHEAIQDLSRRPNPDKTGSIQHAMAALECVARDVAGQPGKTLGKIISDHCAKLNIPRPLDDALEKLWGYACETGRHLREGREPSFEDAELVVTVSAAVSIYLTRSHNT